jgi:glycosyltransferase involved in cell wall biosynthesis
MQFSQNPNKDSLNLLNSSKPVPEVSIGMPVFNGESTIRKALDSLLAQTYTDFELLISDNASTDNTGEICKQYAQKDNRIIYVRQPENRGIGRNFAYVLKQSRGKYFMWACADDIWEPDFIMENLQSFKLDNTIIASVSKVKFLDDGMPSHDTYPLMGSISDNIIKFLKAILRSRNSRFCSLYKRDILFKCYDDTHFLAHDCEIVIKTLVYGKYYEVDKFLLFRSLSGLSAKGLKYNLELNKTRWIDRIFPMFAFTTKILTDKIIPISVRFRCFPILLIYNLRFALSLLKERIISICGLKK